MEKPTHYIFDKDTGKKLYMYNIKTHNVITLQGEHYTHMGKGFTDKVFANQNKYYYFKKINITLENK